MSDLTFRGYWDESDIEETEGYPWETFYLVLWGEEAGDYITDLNKIKEVLNMSGMELILRKKNE